MPRMTYKLFSILYQRAYECIDYEEFLTPHLKQEWLDEYTNSKPATPVLDNIYHLAKMSLTELCDYSGMSQTKFAITYDIPLNQVKKWMTGLVTPPDFITMLVAYTIFMDRSL